MEVMRNNCMPGDSRLVEQLVSELKSQGIFDQFRKECISDVDTKPAYQNLKQRVEGSVSTFLKEQTWSVELNKNQLREQLRKNIHESGFLETGVERIVDQVVNPKINTVFLPKVEEVFYRFIGIENPLRNIIKKEVKMSITDLLPTDLEAISPESVHSFKTESKKADSDILNDSLPSSGKLEDESPAFEPINENRENGTAHDDKMLVDENTRDSHLSGFSGLESHDSNHDSDTKVYQMELSNQDSRASQNSSESHLSIVTSEDATKMEICEDSNIDTIVVKPEPTREPISEEIDPPFENEASAKETNRLEENNENKNDDVIPDENKYEEKETMIDKKTEKTEEKKSKSSSEKSSKDKKDDKHKKSSSSSSKDKDKSSSKHSSQSKSKDPKDKDKKDSKSSSSSRDKDKNKEKSEKDKYDKEKDKSFKYKEKSEKEKNKSDKDKSDKDKVKTDKSKSEKDTANKIEKDKTEKEKSERSKDRSDKSKSERDKSKSEKDKSNRDKDKSDKYKSSKEKEKYKEKTDTPSKSKEKLDKDKQKSSKEKSSSKDKSSSSSKEVKDKYKEENKDPNKEVKDRIKEGNKESSKEKNRSSSSSSKQSSSRDKKPSTPKKESSSQKDKSSSSTSDSKSKNPSDKLKKDETNDKHSGSKKDKQRESKKKSKDDHYSSKIKKTDRRSTDRDSNDGQSSKNYLNYSESASSRSENNSHDYSSSSFTGGSGDSGNSDQVETYNKESNSTSKDPQNNIPGIQTVKYIKPKFAMNFEEARKLMKIRKQLAILERQHQLSLAPFENGIVHEQSRSPTENEGRRKKTVIAINNVEVENRMDTSEEKENMNTSEDVDETTSKEASVSKVVDPKPINKGTKSETDIVHNDVSINNSNNVYENEQNSPVIATIESTDLSKENWEALEAKLAQVMAEVNCNSYDSDEDFEFRGYSSVDIIPKHIIDLSLELVKKTEMEILNHHLSPTKQVSTVNCEKIDDGKQTVTVQERLQNNSEANDSDEKATLIKDRLSNNGEKLNREPNLNNCEEVNYNDGEITAGKPPRNNYELMNSYNEQNVGVPSLKDIIANNYRRLSVVLEKPSTETKHNECRFLEKPTLEEERHLRCIRMLACKLEKEVQDSIEASRNNFWPQKRGRKRKLEEHVDVKNNNKSTYIETVKKRRGSTSSNTVTPMANKKRMCNTTDITPNEHFSLPLSPAESDKSGDRKDEDLLIPMKQKRIIRGYSQRYSSDDLYKPRPVIGARRNKFHKRTG